MATYTGPFYSDADMYAPKPTWEKPCEKCGATIARYRGEGDVTCRCGAEYNAGGQRLRDDWRGNPSTWDDEVSDLDGFEQQHAGD